MSGEQIAEIIRAHQPTTGMSVASGVTCQCGYWNGEERAGIDRPVGYQGLQWHQAQELSAAGFGLVADAKAAALEEAAKECEQTSSNILNKNHALNPAWDGMAEGWKNAATRLRVHASVIRNQS